jgi:hypothetical protein
MTLSTFLNADSATKTDNARSAFAPNTLRKKEAARMRPDEAISAFGTAGK